MRNKLAELLSEAEGQINNDLPSVEQIADYLIEHDVIVKGEVKTLYDRITAMPFDELVSFFTYLESEGIITVADRSICRKCKKEQGGYCPIGADDRCLYDLSDKETISFWLKGADNERN